MSVSQDEMNYLIASYMREGGFHHSAFVFETESMADTTNIAASQIPPNALVSLLQKSLLYMKLEKSIKDAKKEEGGPINEGIWQIENELPLSEGEVAQEEHVNTVEIKEEPQ